MWTRKEDADIAGRIGTERQKWNEEVKLVKQMHKRALQMFRILLVSLPFFGILLDLSKRLVQYKISLGILGAICVILGSAVIGLSISGLYACGILHCCHVVIVLIRGPRNQIAENHVSLLLESATCKLCPANWIEERGMCYWSSKDKKNWIMGYHDCSGKRAQMLVIQDADEMTFIFGIVPEKYPVWIGLNFTTSVKSWTWIDGTTLNKTLNPSDIMELQLPASITSVTKGSINTGHNIKLMLKMFSFSLDRVQPFHSENGANCGVIKDNQARSEMCTAEFRWICEKEAILF
ncbi:killer cell lectin-like receptor subfamily F member 1 [Anolis carolinensis]|uniref:killer cell lectin-like receptor subfamily F member 1 n=1 Tax=Anolis carolinensis TaxID=28377 RepID=UPI002F2B778F